MADNKGKRFFLNALLSLGDPELRKIAERFANSISEDSWLRTDFAERFIGTLKGLLEAWSSSLGPGMSTVVEKFSDTLDFMSSSLYGGEKKGVSAKSVTARDWMDNFFKDAVKRIEKVEGKEELEELSKRLKAEFNARKELIALIEEARKNAQPQKPAPSPIQAGKFVDDSAAKAAVPVGELADRLEQIRGGRR